MRRRSVIKMLPMLSQLVPLEIEQLDVKVILLQASSPSIHYLPIFFLSQGHRVMLNSGASAIHPCKGIGDDGHDNHDDQ